jgi:AcrR family transcriptional regulator
LSKGTMMERKFAVNDASSHQPAGQRRERRDAIENRQRILDAARQLFATQGVAATSMNEIAQVAQVGPGTLYRHFAHKGELCEVLLVDDIAAFWERIDTTLKSDTPGSALSQLGWFIDELIRTTDSHLPLIAVLPEMLKLRPQEAFQAHFYHGMHERITSLLTKAIEQGETVDLDVAFTADAILAAIEPRLFDFQRQYRHFSCEQIATGMRRLFVDGLRVHSVDQRG